MKIFIKILFVILLPCVIYAKHDKHFDVFTADMTPIGNSGVNGQVTIFIQKGKKIFGVGTASNLEANINDQTGNCTAGNGCGVHVHKGTGCGSKEDTRHYWNTPYLALGKRAIQHTSRDCWLSRQAARG